MSDSKRKPEGKKAATNVPAAPTSPASDLAATVTQTVQDVAMKASQRVADSVAQIQAVAGQTVQAARDEVGSVRDEARQSFAQGRQAAMDWERELERNVKSRPLVAILVAGAIGFLLAIIFSDGGGRNDRS